MEKKIYHEIIDILGINSESNVCIIGIENSKIIEECVAKGAKKIVAFVSSDLNEGEIKLKNIEESNVEIKHVRQMFSCYDKNFDTCIILQDLCSFENWKTVIINFERMTNKGAMLLLVCSNESSKNEAINVLRGKFLITRYEYRDGYCILIGIKMPQKKII